jgi:hypothetical protein
LNGGFHKLIWHPKGKLTILAVSKHKRTGELKKEDPESGLQKGRCESGAGKGFWSGSLISWRACTIFTVRVQTRRVSWDISRAPPSSQKQREREHWREMSREISEAAPGPRDGHDSGSRRRHCPPPPSMRERERDVQCHKRFDSLLVQSRARPTRTDTLLYYVVRSRTV